MKLTIKCDNCGNEIKVSDKIIKEYMQQLGKKGGIESGKKKSSEHMRELAKKRWSKKK